jgi:hypothetical protein
MPIQTKIVRNLFTFQQCLLRREKRITALPPIILGGLSDNVDFDHLTLTALSLVQKGRKADWKRKKLAKKQTRILKVMGVYT